MNFGSIFGKSPFAPLQHHMVKAVESVTPLKSFFEALHRQDLDEMTKIRIQIDASEAAADQIKNDVRDHLPRSIFMPIDRRDLLEVLDMQDSIADTAQDIAELLDFRQMMLPQSIQNDLIAFLAVAEKTCKLGLDVSNELGNLVESGFGTRATDKLLKMIKAISDAENKADDQEANMIRKLFDVEDQMKPVDVVFWYEIFGWIGDLADYSKKVGNRIRLMIARS